LGKGLAYIERRGGLTCFSVFLLRPGREEVGPFPAERLIKMNRISIVLFVKYRPLLVVVYGRLTMTGERRNRIRHLPADPPGCIHRTPNQGTTSQTLHHPRCPHRYPHVATNPQRNLQYRLDPSHRSTWLLKAKQGQSTRYQVVHGHTVPGGPSQMD